MWGYAKIMKFFGLTIITTTEYKKMVHNLYSLAKENDRLYKDYQAVRKQLIYKQTYIDTFKRKLDEVIFPNTDERGLGEQEIPVNFPDLW